MAALLFSVVQRGTKRASDFFKIIVLVYAVGETYQGENAASLREHWLRNDACIDSSNMKRERDESITPRTCKKGGAQTYKVRERVDASLNDVNDDCLLLFSSHLPADDLNSFAICKLPLCKVQSKSRIVGSDSHRRVFLWCQ